MFCWSITTFVRNGNIRLLERFQGYPQYADILKLAWKTTFWKGHLSEHLGAELAQVKSPE